MFEEFWSKYPRKVAKRAAQKAWAKLSPQEQKSAVEALVTHNKYYQAKGTGQEFIPHPATWLNQGRWEDELEIAPAQEKVVVWWATEKGTAEMAAKVNCPARPGEDWNSWKARISDKLRAA